LLIEYASVMRSRDDLVRGAVAAGVSKSEVSGWPASPGPPLTGSSRRRRRPARGPGEGYTPW